MFTWSLVELGALQRMTGNYPQAADLLEQAQTIRREIGHRDGEAEILNHQGALLYTSGDPAMARERHLRALELARGAETRWRRHPLWQARAAAPWP
jgi:Flp pilus assembly protein TadD